MKRNDLDHIINCYENNSDMDRADLLNYMNSDDINIVGAIFSLIDKRHDLIKNKIDEYTYYDLYIRYLVRCINDNPDELYADNRHISAYSMCNLYLNLRKNINNYIYIKKIQNELAVLIKCGDEIIRKAVINGTLEHIFELHETINEFSDWKCDAELNSAINEALDWSNNNDVIKNRK